METKNMLYIVSEYANQGEIFGKKYSLIFASYIDIEGEITVLSCCKRH